MRGRGIPHESPGEQAESGGGLDQRFARETEIPLHGHSGDVVQGGRQGNITEGGAAHVSI